MKFDRYSFLEILAIVCSFVSVGAEDSPDMPVAERCSKSPNLVFPHPTECQLYYNCSVTQFGSERVFERHMMECSYPDLFDGDRLKCVSFKDQDLDCGSRTIHKDKCDYRVNSCPVASCMGFCTVNNPSCQNKPDGVQEHGSKPGSPFYMVCEQERLISTGICPKSANGRQTLLVNGNCQ